MFCFFFLIRKTEKFPCCHFNRTGFQSHSVRNKEKKITACSQQMYYFDFLTSSHYDTLAVFLKLELLLKKDLSSLVRQSSFLMQKHCPHSNNSFTPSSLRWFQSEQNTTAKEPQPATRQRDKRPSLLPFDLLSGILVSSTAGKTISSLVIFKAYLILKQLQKS